MHDLINIEQLEGTTIPALLPASTSSTSKNINAQGEVHGNALQVASYRVHEKVVQMLLDKGNRERVSKRYVDGVRGRKGLIVMGRKLVGDAEKQKTLKK